MPGYWAGIMRWSFIKQVWRRFTQEQLHSPSALLCPRFLGKLPIVHPKMMEQSNSWTLILSIRTMNPFRCDFVTQWAA
jgi:hypothetical protein